MVKKKKEHTHHTKTKTTKSKNVVQETWPKVVQGTHLTVTTHEDGRTELKWDDAALLEEVRAATKSVD